MTIYHVAVLLLGLAAIGLGGWRYCTRDTENPMNVYRLTVRLEVNKPLTDQFGLEMLVNLDVPAEDETDARRQVVHQALAEGYTVSAFHSCELIGKFQ